MKRAVILHGTDGKPDSNWFMWLKGKFEAAGYEVWLPLLPNNHVPDRQTYNDFLLGSGWDFTDNVLVGHSSGAVEILNLLMDSRCPHIRFGMMVSGWESGPAVGMDPTQFDKIFPENGYDYELINSKVSKLAMMHGSNDPYVPLAWAQSLASKLDAPLTIVPEGYHLGANYTEFPELWQIIEPAL